jgi:hypothetical protein
MLAQPFGIMIPIKTISPSITQENCIYYDSIFLSVITLFYLWDKNEALQLLNG